MVCILMPSVQLGRKWCVCFYRATPFNCGTITYSSITAFRMAVDIALYRDPDLLSQNAALLPYEIKESRKRTWFGCVAFDR